MDTGSPRLNVVLVEDHDVLRQMLAQALQEANHSVVTLSCAEELEDVAAGQPVDVFLVDLNLPGEDGLSLTVRLRAAYPLAGIIIVTARSGLNDKLEGYAHGADLYLTKPLEVPELCAAVVAQGRRQQRVQDLLTQQHTYTLQQQQLQLTKAGQPPVRLSPAEVAILVTFARAPGQRLAYWQIAETLGLDLQTYVKASLEVRIVRLRKKLVEAGAPVTCIEAIRNHGYQLCIELRLI
ncbi:response regulator transcription factor [Aquabacterium sp.]|uniref:response regulator transcription factor n=1 Tax=Aquabacterium sp. TaxID=1872578 RepID=UPI00262F3C3F|nr:response regulator transcription factor [Aquabacterium sp.]MDD2977417.1 response regulator transcription factor [Aquabacterium sp.]